MFLSIDYSKRVFGLDVLRAIAIFIVVNGHGGFLRGDIFYFIPNFAIVDGVELFFVLSGFLIGGMLLRQLNDKPFSFKELGVFLKRRWFRTLPNYYLILLLNVVFIQFKIIDGSLNDFNWKFFLFLQNFQEGFVGFFWESWSLSIEEWFYIFLPFLLLIFSKFLPLKISFILAIILLIVFPLLYRIDISNQDVDGFWLDVQFRKVVLTRLDAIGFGVLMAYLSFYFNSFFNKIKWVSFLLGCCFIILLMSVSHEPNSFYSKTIYFTFISFSASLFIPLANSVKSFKWQFWGKAISHVSMLSYAMYLINLSLVASFFATYFMPTNKLENLTYFSLYWALVIVISYLIYRFFEKPITDLRDKW